MWYSSYCNDCILFPKKLLRVHKKTQAFLTRSTLQGTITYPTLGKGKSSWKVEGSIFHDYPCEFEDSWVLNSSSYRIRKYESSVATAPPEVVIAGFLNHQQYPSWWLNQPIWKICTSKIGSFPQIGMKNTKCLSCHQLVFQGRWKFRKISAQEAHDSSRDAPFGQRWRIKALGGPTGPTFQHSGGVFWRFFNQIRR